MTIPSLYQIGLLVLSLAMLVQGIAKFVSRQPRQSFLKLLLRVVVWGGMAALAVMPSLTSRLARVVGLEENTQAVILTGFLLVFLIIFKILSVVERIERDISVLARHDALKSLEDQRDQLP